MKIVELTPREDFSGQLRKISVSENRKYKITAKYIGSKGKKHCAYFGIILLDKHGNEITRKIQWLNDFSKILHEIEIIFKNESDCKDILVVYRINKETPVKADCNFELAENTEISIKEVSEMIDENYQTTEDYVLDEIKELTEKEEEILEKNLVWIFGSPRSGTSWLAKQLLSHNTRTIDEPLIGRHLGDFPYRPVDAIIRDFDLRKYDVNYFFAKQYSKTWKKYLRKLILQRIYAQIQDIRITVVLKEPNGTMGSDIISECLPKSKLLLILRDGRDIVDSAIDFQETSWGKRIRDFASVDTDRSTFIRRFSHLWVELITILLQTQKAHNPELSLTIRYEDLRTNTTNYLKKIYNFLNIEISENDVKQICKKFSYENIPDEIKGKGKSVRFAQVDRWKNIFSKEEKELMNSIMETTLTKLGYEI